MLKDFFKISTMQKEDKKSFNIRSSMFSIRHSLLKNTEFLSENKENASDLNKTYRKQTPDPSNP